jgi:hypothetical protein
MSAFITRDGVERYCNDGSRGRWCLGTASRSRE